MRALIHYTHIYHSSSTLSLSSILVRSFHVHRVICQTGTMELVQELLMTAFVALIFSFFLAKLVSIATSRDTEPGLGLKATSDNVRGERVLEETKFDGGLRVQRSKSNRRVRFADESVQKVDKFEAFEEKWGTPVVTGDAAGPIEVVDAVTNLDGLVVEGKKVEEIETEVVIKNEGKVATADLALEEEILDELKQERAVDELEQPCCSDGFEEKLCDSALICDSEGRVKVVEVIGGLWVDSSAEQLQPEAADIGCSGVDMIKEEGVVGNLDGLVVEEGSKGKKVDDVERVSIKEKDEILTNLDGFVDVIEEERVKSNLDGLVVEEVCKGKKADDVERVSIKEEGVVTNLDGLVVEDDGLVVEEGSEGKEVDDVVSVIKEDDAVTSLDGMGVKEGGERKVVDDVESVINEGNEKEDADDIEKRCEGVKGEDTGNEINEEGLVTGLGGLVDKEGGKEVDDVESLTKEGNPMEDLLFEGKIVDNANVDVGDVESVIKEGNVMTGLVFEGKITENADADVGDVVSVIQEGNPMAEKIVEHVDAGCKVDIGSTIDDIVVAQDAKVSDMKSGIEQGLNTGDVKEEEPVGDEEDDWEGIERSNLDEAFAAAAKYVASGGKDERLSNMGSDVQMQLYGLHKVAMEGPCHEPQPMVLKISSRAKWNAWQRMGNMDPEVAMEQYIALLSDKIPGWMEGKSSGDDNADSLESGVPAAPHPNRSMDPFDQHNSTKKRELEDSGADGGV